MLAAARGWLGWLAAAWGVLVGSTHAQACRPARLCNMRFPPLPLPAPQPPRSYSLLRQLAVLRRSSGGAAGLDLRAANITVAESLLVAAAAGAGNVLLTNPIWRVPWGWGRGLLWYGRRRARSGPARPPA